MAGSARRRARPGNGAVAPYGYDASEFLAIAVTVLGVILAASTGYCGASSMREAAMEARIAHMSQTSSTLERVGDQTIEHFGVLVVGAGISGVGAGYHLQDQYPEKSFVILEKFESFGGTWFTHTYPGIRSDSDLYTFGYRFKPWLGKPIATADKILAYIGEVIDENDLDQHIRDRKSVV